ncbi:hypothetical protein CDV31_015841, partial [Fusarium ambrosium]
LAEEKARAAITEKIKGLGVSKHEDTDGFALRYFRRALVDIERSIFVLFHECILSLIYFQNGAGFPVNHNDEEVFNGLAANLSISDGSKGPTFAHFYSVLLEQLATAVAAGVEQTIPGDIVVDTVKHLGTVIDSNWKSFLVDNNQMTFRVPSTLKEAKGWRRVRISSLWATFDGPIDHPERVPYYFILGPRNIDQSSTWEPVQFYIPPFPLQKQWKDGQYIDKDALVKPALFCDGTLGFEPDRIADLNLSDISRIAITFECEAISSLQSSWGNLD